MNLLSIALLAWVVGAQAGASVRPRPTNDPTIYDYARQAFFEPGSAAIRAQSMPGLQQAVSTARNSGDSGELVTGHCDADEIRAGKCPALALARANAVKTALVRLGMKAGTIDVTTEEGAFDPINALNRRVSVEPQYKDSP